MKRCKAKQFEETKHAKREARAREYLDRLGIDFYQAFGKIYVDGRPYADAQTAARRYDPKWFRR